MIEFKKICKTICKILESLKQDIKVPLDLNFPKEQALEIQKNEIRELKSYNYALEIAQKKFGGGK